MCHRVFTSLEVEDGGNKPDLFTTPTPPIPTPARAKRDAGEMTPAEPGSASLEPELKIVKVDVPVEPTPKTGDETPDESKSTNATQGSDPEHTGGFRGSRKAIGILQTYSMLDSKVSVC